MGGGVVRSASIWKRIGWVLAGGLGAAAAIAVVGHVRFKARVAREVREMQRLEGPRRSIDRSAFDRLPAPAARYLRKVIGARAAPVRRTHITHGGFFRTALDGDWVPIRGEQHFTADPPGFIWWGRISLAPGLWVDARDRSVAGTGSMYVAAESLLPIADSRGPELDQGALLRLLGEMSWFPTVFLDDRYVSWTTMDDTHARATLRVGGREVSAVFEFGPDDLPVVFTSERYRDLGGGKAALTPFAGWSRDYRDVDGLLVPHTMIAAWNVDGRWKEYGRFSVEQIAYDAE